MNNTFFNNSKIASSAPTSILAQCGLCGYAKTCRSPKIQPAGKGKKKILIVSEAPGYKEDKKNNPIVFRKDGLLEKALLKAGVNLYKDCIRTNAVICKPKTEGPISDTRITCCRPNLMKTIKKHDPNIIILLGNAALKSLIKPIWVSKVDALGRWAGFCIPNHKPNAWIISTYHPSYLLNRNDNILTKIFEKHIKTAVRKKTKPWETIPNFEKQIEVEMNPNKAAKFLKDLQGKKGNFAFDYECNCLKPDDERAEIVSCSVCWNGKRTIAYPWHGSAIDETIKLLKSKCGKIASNLKFEDRWTKAKLGFHVRNWIWDTMLAAHVLDNRSGITSVKFQSFVLFGVGDYDHHIKPYLKSGKNEFNRIKELDLKELLLYNGLDSLLEYKVAMKQIKMMEKF